ncbi:hypothetical protein [Endozoicomonas sp. ALE010]|uniref:hypothetical protein n=2 Tax=Endozoicomonas TaxID=305899 RepID=UPI003BB48B1E
MIVSAPLTGLLSPLQGTKGTIFLSNSLNKLLRIIPMTGKTHLSIFFATLLCISFFSFAEPAQPWKTGNIKLYGLLIPVIQAEEGDINGFIACYSHDMEMPSYPVEEDIYVKGFVSMEGGQYKGRIFHPEGYLDMDISPVYTTPSTICQEYIPSCQDENTECWAGGDTGGYFGHLLRAINAE